MPRTEKRWDLLKNSFCRIGKIPLPVLVKWVLKISREWWLDRHQRQRDRFHSTYASRSSTVLLRYFVPPPIQDLERVADIVLELTEYYLEHRFDLLGSGWVRIYHGMSCCGLEEYRYPSDASISADTEGRWLQGRINDANVSVSQAIWRLIDNHYVPIDWHLDFKSGYRWSEMTWYKDIFYGHQPGVDVKVPWELSRMQHLPHLAWAYGLATLGYPGFRHPDCYATEFRNQVLDFMATNPPRFGVNWVCAMDVGIRIANWLVSYDLFRAFGANFDTPFVKNLTACVYDHGKHIFHNLEGSEELRGNHYMGNIVSLIFVSAYLTEDFEKNSWLAFAVKSLLDQVRTQFYTDGANFEASTAYHRLSAEMVIYATALVLALPESKQMTLKKVTPFHPLGQTAFSSPFPPWYFERLEKMAEFTLHVTKPDGRIPQFGDNDSGRFLRLQPNHSRLTVAQAKALYKNLGEFRELPDEANYWDENHLDHRDLVSQINALFHRADFERFCNAISLGASCIQSLVRGLKVPSYKKPEHPTAAEQARIGDARDLEHLARQFDMMPTKNRIVLDIPQIRLQEIRCYAYPFFGLYLYRRDEFYLAVRCGSIGQNGHGGHAHNDQLGVELWVNEQDWFSDPGTYLYTPLPDKRSQYRSISAHYAPRLAGREPGNLGLGLFQLGNEARASCLYFGRDAFVGVHYGFGTPVYRALYLREGVLEILDVAEVCEALDSHGPADPGHPCRIPVSPGYGQIYAKRSLHRL